MAVLAITTSGPRGQVALTTGSGAPLLRRLEAGSTRGRDLLPAIVALLAEAGLERSALRGIAVDRGPGSFTGVRIGVTTATTMAYALRIPVTGLSSLALLAAGSQATGPVAAIRDAGRGRLYIQTFAAGPSGALRTATREPARLDPADVRPLVGAHTLVGEDAEALAARASLAGPTECIETQASLLAHLTKASLEGGEAATATSLAPLYLQASAPERKRAGEPEQPRT